MGKRLRKKGRADLLPHDLMKFHQKNRLEEREGSKNRILYDSWKTIDYPLIDATETLNQIVQPLLPKSHLYDLMGSDYYFVYPNTNNRVLVPLECFDEVFEGDSEYFRDWNHKTHELGKRAYYSPRDFPVPSEILEPIPFEINGSWVEAFQFTEGNEDYLKSMGSDDFYDEFGISEVPIINSDITLPIIQKGVFEEDEWTIKYVLLYRSLDLDWWIMWNKENPEVEADFSDYQYFHAHELKSNLDLLLMHYRYNSQGTETNNETARLAEKNKRFIIRPDMVQKLERTNYSYPAELLKIGPYRNGIVFDFDYCDDSFLHYDWDEPAGLGVDFMSTIFVFETEHTIWFNCYGDIECTKTLPIPKKNIVDENGNITPKLVRSHIRNLFNIRKKLDKVSKETDSLSEEEATYYLKLRDELHQTIIADIQHPFFNYDSDDMTICPELLRLLLFEMTGIGGRWNEHTSQTLKELEKFWNQVVSTCLNLCIYIQSPISEPEIRQVSGIEKTQRGGKIRTKLPYRVLGKTGVKYVSSKTSNPTGEKRAMHLRSGHWRTQPIKHRSGKEAKYIQEKSDGSLWITHWIQSTWVNSNETEKVSSQDIAIGVTNENKSLAEKRAVEMLQQYFPDLKHNGRYPWLRNRQGNMLELDIYINQKGLRFAVEMDGEQHYIPSAKFGGREAFRVRKANDVAKDKICREKNIPLIRIRNRDWDMELDSLIQAIRSKLPEKMLSSFDEVVLMGTVK